MSLQFFAQLAEQVIGMVILYFSRHSGAVEIYFYSFNSRQSFTDNTICKLAYMC